MDKIIKAEHPHFKSQHRPVKYKRKLKRRNRKVFKKNRNEERRGRAIDAAAEQDLVDSCMEGEDIGGRVVDEDGDEAEEIAFWKWSLRNTDLGLLGFIPHKSYRMGSMFESERSTDISLKEWHIDNCACRNGCVVCVGCQDEFVCETCKGHHLYEYTLCQGHKCECGEDEQFDECNGCDDYYVCKTCRGHVHFDLDCKYYGNVEECNCEDPVLDGVWCLVSHE
jgi:hypothetical protein